MQTKVSLERGKYAWMAEVGDIGSGFGSNRDWRISRYDFNDNNF